MRDPIVSKLCYHWQANTPVEAIVRAVNFHFPELTSASGSVDVKLLARKRGAVVLERTMQLDGTISSTGGNKYVVELNKAHSEARKRFTCGHEIGHTFFFDLTNDRSTRARTRIQDGNLEELNPNRVEERLCNLAAAEILMPFRPFIRDLNTRGFSARAVEELSSKYKTSIRATALRVLQVSNMKAVIALLDYDHKRDCFVSVWAARSISNAPGKKLEIGRDSALFDELASETPFRGRRWVPLGGPVERYHLDCFPIPSKGPKRTLAVFFLDRHAEKLIWRSQATSREPGQQLKLF